MRRLAYYPIPIKDVCFDPMNTIYCKAITPPVAVKFTEGDFNQYQFWNIFDGITPEYKIYVPVASVDAYKNADGWSDYADRIVGYDFE